MHSNLNIKKRHIYITGEFTSVRFPYCDHQSLEEGRWITHSKRKQETTQMTKSDQILMLTREHIEGET